MIPHLRVPIVFVNGQAEVVEQDTTEEVLECCKNILRYPIGFRDDLPEFGSPDLLFGEIAAGAATEPVRAALETWEPRALVEIEQDPSLLHELTQVLNVKISEEGRA